VGVKVRLYEKSQTAVLKIRLRQNQFIEGKVKIWGENRTIEKSIGESHTGRKSETVREKSDFRRNNSTMRAQVKNSPSV
jgi:hypothetical protein